MARQNKNERTVLYLRDPAKLIPEERVMTVAKSGICIQTHRFGDISKAMVSKNMQCKYIVAAQACWRLVDSK